MKATLLRFSRRPEFAQRGLLFIEEDPICVTLELPVTFYGETNKPSMTCIPLGEYVCEETRGRKTPGGMHIERTFEVKDVPHRSGILFHVGNFTTQTHGCILIGSQFRWVNDEWAIEQSKEAFKKFLAKTDKINEFILSIKQVNL